MKDELRFSKTPVSFVSGECSFFAGSASASIRGNAEQRFGSSASGKRTGKLMSGGRRVGVHATTHVHYALYT